MKTLYNTLKVQDYFYIIFLHEFKGETKQHSYISVFLSLIVNVVTITIFFINFSHLLKRNEPSISYSKIDLLKGINITMNTQDLLFSIFLRDKNHSPLNNPSLITINATYEILYRNRDGNINNQVYQLDIINCSNFYNDYINNNIQSQYNENDIKLHYCFNIIPFFKRNWIKLSLFKIRISSIKYFINFFFFIRKIFWFIIK